DVDIDEIRTFVAIAQLGGFTRAADRLHRSQPAISRRIGLIEQELGAPLLERAHGGAGLTEAGPAPLPLARAVPSARPGRPPGGHATINEAGAGGVLAPG